MRFGNESTILLVGEGNFSFTLSLIDAPHGIHANRILATCLQTQEKLSAQAQVNAAALVDKGVAVHFGIDATQLHTYPCLKDVAVDVIIFNFPHIGGKMKISKNRELLRFFFESASRIMAANSSVLVTLCQGQGGTPEDLVARSWNDTWQIVVMATYGNLILHSIQQFDPCRYLGYDCTGFRSLEKKFHTTGALTHTFKKQIFTLDTAFLPPFFSLYPPVYSHDLSLWKQEVPFTPEDFACFVHQKYPSVVQSVTLIDEFVCPLSFRQSHCYRFVYSSRYCSLSPPKAFWLHSVHITEALKVKFNIVTR